MSVRKINLSHINQTDTQQNLTACHPYLSESKPMQIIVHCLNLRDNTKLLNIWIIIDVIHCQNCISILNPLFLWNIKISQGLSKCISRIFESKPSFFYPLIYNPSTAILIIFLCEIGMIT